MMPQLTGKHTANAIVPTTSSMSAAQRVSRFGLLIRNFDRCVQSAKPLAYGMSSLECEAFTVVC